MSFKWQDKHMELFIETYKQYECLWNNKCVNYSKSNARERAYSLMLNDLNIPGLTVPDIKAKIKTIRTRYGAELAKIRNSERNGATGDEVYEPRLFWFKDADAFLRKVCASKPNYIITKDQEVTQKEISPEKINDSNQLYEENDSTSPKNSTNSPVASFLNPLSKLQHRKNVWKRSIHSNVPTTSKAIKKFKQISNEIKEDPNEFDFFCESLAIQLKKMPLQRAIICQEKLQSVMTQERLFQLGEPHPSQLPMSSPYQHFMSIRNQNSEHYSTISSTCPRIEPVIETDIHDYDPEDEDEDGNGNGDEDEDGDGDEDRDNKSENISEMKREI